MKKIKINTAISIVLPLLLNTIATAKELTVDEKKIPSISKEKLDKIVNTDIGFYIEDLTTLEENAIQKNSIGSNRKTYLFDNILASIEERHKNSNSSQNILYLSVNKGIKVNLTKEQYKELLDTINIDDFILKFNNYTNMNFSKHNIYERMNEKIIYIGDYASSTLDYLDKKGFVLLKRKNGAYRDDSINKKCSTFYQAFLYFKDYNLQADRKVKFDLTHIEIMELYMKLAKWHVDMRFINEILLNMFKEKAQYVNNFDFDQAFLDLQENPSSDIARRIKKDLQYTIDNKADEMVLDKKGVFVISSSMRISNILKKLSKIENGNYYLDADYCFDAEIEMLVSNEVVLRNFSDLEDYMHNSTTYGIKIIENKYVLNADKKIIIFKNKDKSHQAIHFLDASIKEVLKNGNDNFSKEAFVSDINDIKREYL